MLLLLLLVFGLDGRVFSQNYMYDWGVRADLGPAQYSGDLEKQITRFGFKAPMVAGSFSMYMTPFIDLQLGGSLFLLYHKNPDPPPPASGDVTEFGVGFFAVNALARFKLNNGYIFSEDNLLSPYFVSGIGLNTTGGGYIGSALIPSIPFGLGVTYHMSERYSINAEWVLHTTFYDRLDDYSNTQGRWADGRNDRFAFPTIGFQYNFGPEAGELSDADEDGIPDIEDLCPTRPGSETAEGCPDTDGDGLLDEDDACPNQGGPSTTRGCPDKDGDSLPDWQDRCPERAGPPNAGGCPDTDADGLTDDIDQCPDKKGLRSLSGCPDTDGDGVADNLDKCPNAAGSRALNGCADGDRDGVSDDVDECPEEAGPASMKGCPDSDGDGVSNATDRCPDERGSAADGGCPPARAAAAKEEEKAQVQEELKSIVQNLQFEVAKAIIAQNSLDDLDRLVDVLNRYPKSRLSIEGHTDDQGEVEKNMRLSRERATAVMNYLIEQGIDAGRLKAEGYGPTRPVVPNTSRENRAKNRRVELILTGQ